MGFRGRFISVLAFPQHTTPGRYEVHSYLHTRVQESSACLPGPNRGFWWGEALSPRGTVPYETRMWELLGLYFKHLLRQLTEISWGFLLSHWHCINVPSLKGNGWKGRDGELGRNWRMFNGLKIKSYSALKGAYLFGQICLKVFSSFQIQWTRITLNSFEFCFRLVLFSGLLERYAFIRLF